MYAEIGVQETVIAKIKAEGKRFRDFSDMLRKTVLSVKLRKLVYEMYITSAMNYKAECWVMKVNDIKRMQFTQVRMPKDKVKIELILKITSVESLKEFLTGQKLK